MRLLVVSQRDKDLIRDRLLAPDRSNLPVEIEARCGFQNRWAMEGALAARYAHVGFWAINCKAVRPLSCVRQRPPEPEQATCPGRCRSSSLDRGFLRTKQ